MLHIYVCDDQDKEIDIICAAIEKYCSDHPDCQIDCHTFDNPLLFLESLDQYGGCDIALLDICMPGLRGTEVAREIRQRRDKTEIIFLTTSDEFAVEAFALHAAHYLVKPFTQAQFDEAMNRALACFAKGSPKKLPVRTMGGAIVCADICDILYIESMAHTITVHLKEADVTESRRSLTRLQEELEKLSPGQFVMPYKGYLVNQRAIRTLEQSGITLKNGAVVPVTRRGFGSLRERYFDYMFGNEDVQ